MDGLSLKILRISTDHIIAIVLHQVLIQQSFIFRERYMAVCIATVSLFSEVSLSGSISCFLKLIIFQVDSGEIKAGKE